MKAKVGDTVHVKGTIVRGSSVLNYPMVRFALAAGTTGEVCVSDDDIVHVEPAPLKVGDRVTWVGFPAGESGQILAIDAGVAWVKLSKGGRLDLYLNVLERADEPRPLKVGDKVRFIGCKISHETGEIVRIDRGDIWVKWGSFHTPTQWSFAELERVE